MDEPVFDQAFRPVDFAGFVRGGRLRRGRSPGPAGRRASGTGTGAGQGAGAGSAGIVPDGGARDPDGENKGSRPPAFCSPIHELPAAGTLRTAGLRHFLILLFFGLSGFLAALKAGSVGYHDLSSAFGSATAVLLLLGTVVSLLWALFYTFFRDGFGGGRSWGKRICGLMVVRLADNRPCTLGLSFVRNVVGVILAFVLAWIPIVGWFAGFVEPVVAAVHGKGWRIGDMLAKTQVIDAGKYRA